MSDAIKKLYLAMTVLTDVFLETKASEVADALNILSAWREEYVKENSQFGAGS